MGEDAFTWLAKAAKKDERFDLVILDPPSYSSRPRSVASWRRSDYDELVALAAAVVAPGGRILVVLQPSRDGARRSYAGWSTKAHVRRNREAVQLKDLPDAPDFPAWAGAIRT